MNNVYKKIEIKNPNLSAIKTINKVYANVTKAFLLIISLVSDFSFLFCINWKIERKIINEKINLGIIVGCIPWANISGTSSKVKVYANKAAEIIIITLRIFISFIIMMTNGGLTPPLLFSKLFG